MKRTFTKTPITSAKKTNPVAEALDSYIVDVFSPKLNQYLDTFLARKFDDDEYYAQYLECMDDDEEMRATCSVRSMVASIKNRDDGDGQWDEYGQEVAWALIYLLDNINASFLAEILEDKINSKYSFIYETNTDAGTPLADIIFNH